MNADEDMYDEFGNPIEDEEDGSSDDNQSDGDAEYRKTLSDISDEEDDDDDDDNNKQVALPNADQSSLTLSYRFGPGVETIVAKPSVSDSTEPVIKPNVQRRGKVEFSDTVVNDRQDLPPVNYSRDYMINMAKQVPERIRNVALVGNLHCGKTTFLDMLILQTHPELKLSNKLKNFKPLRFMDNHVLEISRGMTIKASPVTLLLPDMNERSYIFNIVDTPGHVNFHDENVAALRACDGMILMLDAVEGLTFRDKQLLDEALMRNIPITLVINKLDRLILELKLPVPDSYYKLEYIIDDVNNYIGNNQFIGGYSHETVFSPQKNNVNFSSGNLQFCFNLNSFSKLYFDTNTDSSEVNISKFSKKLWGNNFYDPQNNKFTKDSNKGTLSRTFIHFILEPIYKVITYTLTRDNNTDLLPGLLRANFGITLTKAQLTNDSQILLTDIFKAIFPQSFGFVNSIVDTIPSPVETPDSSESLRAHVVKLVESSDGEFFYSMVRISQGSLSVGDKVTVIGSNFNEDKDDYKVETVTELYIPCGRYKIPVSEVNQGFIAIVRGIESIIAKEAFLFPEDHTMSSIKSIPFVDYGKDSVFKVAVEPKHPSELPRLMASLRKINKSYLSSLIKVEESGEHVIFGTGEIMMDCLLHDIRNFFDTDLEIKVSDPMVKLSETCSEPSITKIATKSNTGSKISIVSEPMDNYKLSNAIELEKIDLSQPIKITSKLLRTEYGLDALESRSLWGFGPSDLRQPSLLFDDTLESETNKALLYSVKDAINLGFKWCCNEGPLCEEPIRNTKFKILDIDLVGSDGIQTSTAQIIPMTRRACYTGFMTASPKLMEPIYKVFIHCTYKVNNVISKILDKRRASITSNDPIPGTSLYVLEGHVPVIESFGLETDIRLQSQGQAMCYLTFENYDIVPGNPLDDEVYLPDLKPVPTESIARDLVLKTRRRKGITGDPTLQKYIEPELYEKLKSVGFT